jgi:hypothetical protein
LGGVQDGSAPDRRALAEAAPGFGGLFIDADGVPSVYLRDLGVRGAVERGLGSFLRLQGVQVASLQVLAGDFDYLQLEAWYEQLWPEAFAAYEVVFADLSESRNRIVVGVASRAFVRPVEALAQALGIPGEALVVEVVEPIRSLLTLREQAPQIQGGYQINFGRYLCTLGFNALSGAQESFITNSHCTDRQGGVEGTVYFQPVSTVDPAPVGVEVADPEYFRRGICPNGRRCRYSDAARVRQEPGRTFTRGAIARPSGFGTVEVAGSFTITGAFRQSAPGQDCPVEGAELHKVGQTSGWTVGTVTLSCVAVGVAGSNIVLLDQVWVDGGVSNGDSGAPVFSIDSGDEVTLYGILWGGTGSGNAYVFSPMTNIELELGPLAVTSGSGEPVTESMALTVQDLSPSVVGPSQAVEVQIVGTGFAPGAVVSFERGGGPAPTASDVSVLDASTLSLMVITRSGGPPHAVAWDVRVTNPEGRTTVLPGGLTVSP